MVRVIAIIVHMPLVRCISRRNPGRNAQDNAVMSFACEDMRIRYEYESKPEKCPLLVCTYCCAKTCGMKLPACANYNKTRHPKKVVLEKTFAGVAAGKTLFIGTPQIVADYITKIPVGETVSIRKLRNRIARNRRCDAMCPVSTAIFLRIVAEFAIEEMANGKSTGDVVPFWRVIGADDKLAKKLPIDRQWITVQRTAEASV